MSARGRQERNRFDLKRALLVSVLLHLLLLALSPVLSWQWGETAEPVEETVLEFDLTPAVPVPPPPVPEPVEETAEPEPLDEQATPAPDSPEPEAVEALGSPTIGDDADYATPVPGFEDPPPSEELPAPPPEQAVPEESPPLGEQEPSDPAELGQGALPPIEQEDLGAEVPDPGSAQEEASGEPADVVEPPTRSETFDVGRAMDDLDRLMEERTAPEIEPPTEQEPPEDPGALNLPDSMSLPTRGFQFGAASIRWESGDPRLQSYARQMLIYLNRLYLRRQYVDRGRFERWAYRNSWYASTVPIRISFTVLRSGEMHELRIDASSGLEPLDDVTRDTLLEAVLQPLPSDFPREEERFELTTTNNGAFGIREFLAWLRQVHRAGLID